MRLIDADELRRRILAFATGCHSEVLAVDTIMMLLAQASTINPDDLRPQGRWIDIDRLEVRPEWICRCSLCGCPQDFKHHYCPNCGADMRGDAGDEK